MQLIELDVCGLSCPIPVLQVKKSLGEHPEGLKVITDAVASRENIVRFAEASGYNVSVSKENNAWTLLIKK